METKNWWESRTIWLNILTVLASVLALPESVGIIPAAALPFLLWVNAVGNIVLRVFYTDTVVKV